MGNARRRFAFGPLAGLVVADSQGELARALGTSRKQLARWADYGLDIVQADRVAVWLGYHPAEIWPHWLEQRTPVDTDLARRRRRARSASRTPWHGRIRTSVSGGSLVNVIRPTSLGPSNICSLGSPGMADNLDPHELERLRRSIAMLRPGQPAGLKREEAMRLLEELQRLERSDRRHAEVVERIRAMLDGS